MLQKLRLTFLLAILLSIPLSLFPFKPLSAHELKPAIADVSLEQVTGKPYYAGTAAIKLNLESLMAEVGVDHDNTDSSPNRERYIQLRQLSAEELRAASIPFQTSFAESLSIVSNTGRKLAPENLSIEVITEEDSELARNSIITLDFEFAVGETGFTWQWPERYGDIILRTESRSTETTDLAKPANLDYAALLSPGQRSETIQLGAITEVKATTTFFNYLVIGFQHIIPKGLDHILFVIGIFLLSPYWKPLLVQVTTFTFAHSITLAMTILGYIAFPASIVEPLIALSIVYVCVENLFLQNVRKLRVALVFMFGLLHGMGFATVLAEVGLQPEQFVVALVSFNIGVELGQLAILAGCLLLMGFWCREKSWYRQRISIPLSVVIGAVGCYWFVQRTMQLV